MELYEKYFPRGIAKGKAFCNRIKERERLRNNIVTSQQTLIKSPRRYGKSSLALRVLDDLDITYTRVDFFVTMDPKSIQKQIIKGVNSLFSQTITAPEQALKILKTIKKSFQNINLKLIAGTSGINFEVEFEGNDIANNILDALQALSQILEKKETKAVLFLDEIQQIGKLAKGMAIEGAIRNVAQESEHLVFIFSGSNRHLIASMFEDSARPLYNLCDDITINRIGEKDYVNFLSSLAIKAWGAALSNDELGLIFSLTERHPFYMNILCRLLWHKQKKPGISDINSYWNTFVEEKKTDVTEELEKLSMPQRYILNAIAHGQKSNLTGKEFLSKAGISSATVIKSLKVLKRKDYIYKIGRDLFVLDPLIKSALILFAS